MNWKNKQILVTGAGGFIGSHLTEELIRRGAKVKALVHYNSQGSWGWLDDSPAEIKTKLSVVLGDVTDYFSVREAMRGCEVVFHLAALIAIPFSYIAPNAFVNINIVGTTNVLQAARELKLAKIVHTSTSESYGTAQYAPIDEKHPLQAQSPYSATKIGADKLAESFYCSFDVPVATIRPFNTYGPRQSARAVIPTIISQIVAGYKKIKLGSLSPVRDLTFVMDTVEGFIKVAESKKSVGELINVGSGFGITIGELTEKIIGLMNAQVEIIADERRVRPEKSEVMKLICNNKMAQDYLGWQPRYSLDQGLSSTIDFIKDNINRYKPESYNI